ncbi:DNA-protecting protein DprA [Nocardia terpenica]|uniref:DNA-processing protein DprA n=1 Tax=Nocardia terpenica TaxID=455432 RepID=UPI001892F94F|nr:DNA-processing protein DprA [Nocardia terpenica]MBF6063546.1 DNA-protecting protein DprA [Nocardia terpenica]MBF6106102.1 DNA-protecting protein DprA [Nocardia terpenica]MBF6113313.1 DNA-protecting protein DprA [Nocardia terpenica]MBF6119843.1 DNA-protecting protein DprA [Nocardia terpenica]
MNPRVPYRLAPCEDRGLAWALLSRAALAAPQLVRGLLAVYGPMEAADRLASGSADPRFGEHNRGHAREDLARIAALGGRLLTRDDTAWPADRLADLDTFDAAAMAPLALWTRGLGVAWLTADRAVAVTGSRACTPYGLAVTSDIVSDLARHKWTIVSGAGYGVDAEAHRVALDASAPTIAVLANGLHRPFPPGNADLIARLAADGLLVSEYPPGVETAPDRLRARQRLVAALTAGVVVCETGIRGSTRGTAAWAQRLARPLFAVPGPITSAASRGGHDLIRAGHARPVTTGQHIHDALTS